MRLTSNSKPGCHLCVVMKGLVRQVISDRSPELTLEEVDISTDADLMNRYGTEIPVLMIDGRKVAKYRVGENELRRMLEVKET